MNNIKTFLFLIAQKYISENYYFPFGMSHNHIHLVLPFLNSTEMINVWRYKETQSITIIVRNENTKWDVQKYW